MKRIFSYFVILFLVCIALTNCNNKNDNTQSRKGVQSWEFDPTDTIIKNGTDIIDLIAASDPCLLKDDSGYKLYYTGVGITQEDIDAAAPEDPVPTARICLATSTDGISFTRHPDNPVLDVAPEGNWDSLHLETPFVMKKGAEYWLYYFGYDTEEIKDVIAGAKHTLGSIGLAKSSDGVHFTRVGTEPVLSPSPLTDVSSYVGSWDSWALEGPCIIEIENEYWMYYGAAGCEIPGEMINSIGLAKSIDGLNWTKYKGNPLMNESSSAAWDRYHVIDPSILKYNDQYILWYQGGDKYYPIMSVYGNFHIGTAYSKDGINWTKDENNPVLRNDVIDWTAYGIMAPTVIEEDDKFIMFFHGIDDRIDSFSTWAIGRAVWSK